MKRVVIIHGWEGTPDGHWKTWLREKLEEKNCEVIAPQMPNAYHPKLLEWINHIREVTGEVDENTFFVGHSLGCIAIVRFLATLPKDVQAGGVVLVAGFSGDLGEKEIQEFYSSPEEVIMAKEHCSHFVTIFSRDDDAVPFEVGLEFQRQLDATLIIEENKGHFTKDDGVTELPSVLDSLSEMMK